MDRRTMLAALSGFAMSSLARPSRAVENPPAGRGLIGAIHDASDHRAPEMLKTPLLRSTGLSKLFQADVLLKCEHLQTTGSFKYRGASNKIRLLDAAERRRGVVTASSGNHGLAVALAGRHAGVQVTVYAPSTASAAKLDAIRSYGATLELIDDGITVGETKHSLEGRAAAKRTGRPFISPYNDLDVIAGQGTIGLEILSEAPKTDLVFLSVGGGGLAGGVGIALDDTPSSRAKLVGCWPHNAPALLRAIEAGKIYAVREEATISDGTAGGLEPGAMTLGICSRVIHKHVEADEQLIKEAMWALAEHDHWMVEGASGVALTGLSVLRNEVKGKTAVVVLCGRNITARDYQGALEAGKKQLRFA